MYERRAEDLTLQVELGGAKPEKVENADGWVLLPSGERWAATFLTYRELGRILERWEASGECLNGSYFTCPDLVLIRRPGVAEMFAAVRDLVENGDYRAVLQLADESDGGP